MKPIDDNELILHHWRDGLDAARMAGIDAELERSPALRARRAALLALLARADALPVPQPRAGFEQRVWQGLSARIAGQSPRAQPSRWVDRMREGLFGLRTPWLGAAAFAMLCVIAISFQAGRQSVPALDGPSPAPSTAMATRVLDSYVARHLRATEGLLMTAVNDGGTPLGSDRELAAALVDSNRLYALAATRAGNARLADFLRQLEPVLIELANPAGPDSVQSVEGLRDYVRRTDLLFEVRATGARIDPLGKRSL